MTIAIAPSRRLGRPVTRTLRYVAIGVAAALAAGASWLAVGDDADQGALVLALATYGITTSDDGTVLAITPSGPDRVDVGIVFIPGTRIAREAYVATWAPIVEATGVAVHIPAVPLNLPALAGDPIGDIIAANPGIPTWIVGGHSMGGFEAAAYTAATDERPAGLLLWGSGPARTDLSEVALPTLLVAGEADSVLPLDRALREGSLPPGATIEVVDGMTHGQFGRYGDEEVGDRGSGRSNAETLDDLAAATAAFLRGVAPDGVFDALPAETAPGGP